MRHCGQYLSLAVPGLAEGRPSLLVGDRVIVCDPGKEGGREEPLREEALVKEGGKRPTYAMYASCLIVNLYPLVLGGGEGVGEG